MPSAVCVILFHFGRVRDGGPHVGLQSMVLTVLPCCHCVPMRGGVQLLDVEPEEGSAEDGANVDLDSERKGKTAVIKTSTRSSCQ
jgi:hypothetical protein